MPTNVTLPGQLFARSSGKFSSAPDWPMRTGYFTPQKMPLNVIYPRPDAETQAHARHRWAHSQMRYEIPIGVQGGAWPFKYEILSAPAWLSIGQYYGDENYGVLHGTPNSTGTHNIVVRVTGADNVNTVDVTFSVKSDISNHATVDAKFTFIQSGYSGTKTGSITQPLGTMAEWYGGAQSNAAYHNQIIVLRGGTYYLTSAPSEDNGNIRLASATKTPTLIGFPDEDPVIDCSTAKILDDAVGLHDMFFANITYKNARNDVENAHYFWIVGTSNRMTWWNNRFIDMSYGTTGNDNTGPIFIGTTATVKNHCFIKSNSCSNILNGSGHGAGNGTLYTLYRLSNVLIESNIASSCSTGTAINAKGTVANVTIRDNTAFSGMVGTMAGLGYGAEAVDVPHDHEICWNNFNSPNDVIIFANSPYYAGQTYNTFVYRNTLQSSKGICQSVGAENFKTDANILNFSSYTSWNESIQTSVFPNIKTTAVTPSGNLTGALGFATNGSEVYV